MPETLYRSISGKGRVPIPEEGEDGAIAIRAQWAAEEEKRRNAPPPPPTLEERIADLEARIATLEQGT